MFDETARFELHEGVREALGESRGDTLMSMLPPVGWADVATKQDTDALRVATKQDIDALRVATKQDIDALRLATKQDIDALRVTTKQDIDGLRLDVEALRVATKKDLEVLRLSFEKSMADLESRLHQEMNRQTWSIIGALIAIAAVLTANNVL